MSDREKLDAAYWAETVRLCCAMEVDMHSMNYPIESRAAKGILEEAAALAERFRYEIDALKSDYEDAIYYTERQEYSELSAFAMKALGVE